MEVTFGNQKIALKGERVSLGDKAQNFVAIDTDLQVKTLQDYDDDYLVISVVPSVDTGVCDYQTKTFNKNLASFKNVRVITISNDLPFALKRWCGAAGLDHVVTLSDHRDLDFAKKYGTLLEPLRLQTRAVFVLDAERQVIYKEYVEDVSSHPSYDEVTMLLKEVTK